MPHLLHCTLRNHLAIEWDWFITNFIKKPARIAMLTIFNRNSLEHSSHLFGRNVIKIGIELSALMKIMRTKKKQKTIKTRGENIEKEGIC